jgi:phosphoribosylaminoimidazole (AIR) synthetase
MCPNRYKTFNSGIGMIVVVDSKDVDLALMTSPGTFVVGEVSKKSNASVEFF